MTIIPHAKCAYDTLRWISRDPIGERGGINLYGYVGNNSLYWVDPLGLSWTQTLGVIGGAGGFIVGGGLSILEEIATYGVATPAIPEEIAGTTTGGAALGAALGAYLDGVGGSITPHGPTHCDARPGSKPTDAPPGTRAINEDPRTKDDVHDIKPQLRGDGVGK